LFEIVVTTTCRYNFVRTTTGTCDRLHIHNSRKSTHHSEIKVTLFNYSDVKYFSRRQRRAKEQMVHFHMCVFVHMCKAISLLEFPDPLITHKLSSPTFAHRSN